MEILSGSSESSTVEQVTRHNSDDDDQNQMVGIAYEFEGCDENSELELGLGLSLGVTNTVNKTHNHNHRNLMVNNEINSEIKQQQIPRILTAKDLGGCVRNVVVSPPSSASSCSSLGLRPSTKTTINNNNNNNNNNSGVTNNNVSNNNNNNVSAGTKRAASPTAVSQVVGWPPIRSYRMNSMANQAKSIATGERDLEFDESKGKEAKNGAEDKGKADSKDRLTNKGSLFVKVNMDGVAIGRKVNLTVHTGYESLAQILEDMFTNRAAEKSNAEELLLMPKATRPSRLLDGLSEFVLTYEDKDGDWMLVGDVPWGMFVNSVKRLRIMRTSEANGLGAPRSEERSAKQRNRPI